MNNIKKGEKYGSLTILSEELTKSYYIKNGVKKYLRRVFKCQCDCGKIKNIRLNDLQTGHTKSCGCLRVKTIKSLFITHGETRNRKASKEYYTYNNMIRRCKLKSKDYIYYRKRGIKVCGYWVGKNGYQKFLLDMGRCPPNKSSIDRIDNNKGYYKENCHWVTFSEQCRNKRSNRFLTFNNKTQCVIDWGKELNIKPSIIYKRIYRGWSVEKTLLTPTLK